MNISPVTQAPVTAKTSPSQGQQKNTSELQELEEFKNELKGLKDEDALGQASAESSNSAAGKDLGLSGSDVVSISQGLGQA